MPVSVPQGRDKRIPGGYWPAGLAETIIQSQKQWKETEENTQSRPLALCVHTQASIHAHTPQCTYILHTHMHKILKKKIKTTFKYFHTEVDQLLITNMQLLSQQKHCRVIHTYQYAFYIYYLPHSALLCCHDAHFIGKATGVQGRITCPKPHRQEEWYPEEDPGLSSEPGLFHPSKLHYFSCTSLPLEQWSAGLQQTQETMGRKEETRFWIQLAINYMALGHQRGFRIAVTK